MKDEKGLGTRMGLEKDEDEGKCPKEPYLPQEAHPFVGRLELF
jgi:hypothetical protein